MAKRVFFSFHYDTDIMRAQVVRNSWVTQPDRTSAGFFDASVREEAKKKDGSALRAFIRRGLQSTSVTAVLIGAKTAEREWVLFEIAESVDRGSGLVGIYVDGMKDFQGRASVRGRNPFTLGWTKDEKDLDLSDVPMYDWVAGDGYKNLGGWVANAYVAT
jgi:hypothetical protein